MKTANRKYPEGLLAELHELWVRFAVPPNRRRLITEQLTTDEVQSLQEGQGGNLEELFERVASGEILHVVAQQRGWTRERALLDLAFGIDMIGAGRHQYFRRAIGEPAGAPTAWDSVVGASQTKPAWDRSTGTLYLGENLVGKFRICKAPTRIQIMLDAFEEADWPTMIEQPYGDVPYEYIYRDVHELNNKLHGISFHVQAGATQITWELKPK